MSVASIHARCWYGDDADLIERGRARRSSIRIRKYHFMSKSTYGSTIISIEKKEVPAYFVNEMIRLAAKL